MPPAKQTHVPAPDIPTASEIRVAVVVQVGALPTRAAQREALNAFAEVIAVWVEEGLRRASAEIVDRELVDSDFAIETAVSLPTAGVPGAIAVGVEVWWPGSVADARAALAFTADWLAEILASEDEPAHWRRDVLRGKTAKVRPLAYEIKSQFTGEAETERSGPIRVG